MSCLAIRGVCVSCRRALQMEGGKGSQHYTSTYVSYVSYYSSHSHIIFCCSKTSHLFQKPTWEGGADTDAMHVLAALSTSLVFTVSPLH